MSVTHSLSLTPSLTPASSITAELPKGAKSLGVFSWDDDKEVTLSKAQINALFASSPTLQVITVGSDPTKIRRPASIQARPIASISSPSSAPSAAKPMGLEASSSSSSAVASPAKVEQAVYEPGQVSPEQVAKITALFTQVIVNPENYGPALQNFKLMLASEPAMETRRAAVNEAASKLTPPQRALFNVTSTFFKEDLKIKLKGTFDAMIAAFPDKRATLDQALEIGVKMAVAPKLLGLFDSISAVSRNYIGNQVEREQAGQSVVVEPSKLLQLIK